jgi:hypothetical protein
VDMKGENPMPKQISGAKYGDLAFEILLPLCTGLGPRAVRVLNRNEWALSVN